MSKQNNVVNLDEHRPHFIIQCDEGDTCTIHVLPVSNVEKWAQDPVANANLVPMDVIRRIVNEWCGWMLHPDFDPTAWEEGD